MLEQILELVRKPQFTALVLTKNPPATIEDLKILLMDNPESLASKNLAHCSGCKYFPDRSCFVFPTPAVIYVKRLPQNLGDAWFYNGQVFQFIWANTEQQMDPRVLSYMKTRLRSRPDVNPFGCKFYYGNELILERN